MLLGVGGRQRRGGDPRKERFIDHVEIQSGAFVISEAAGSAAFINGPKVAIEETADYTAAHTQSMCYALDTSASNTPFLALGLCSVSVSVVLSRG